MLSLRLLSPLGIAAPTCALRTLATKQSTRLVSMTTLRSLHITKTSIVRPSAIRLLYREYSDTTNNTGSAASSKHMVFRDLNYIQKPVSKITPTPLTSQSTALSTTSVPTALTTKETLLSEATGSWQRFAIRSKWLLLKSYRPFNVDDFSAFFSWFILSHIIWIIVGTTTFFSLLFLGLNSLFTRELVGNAMGKLLMWMNPSFRILFEDAVVPGWKDGMIEFKKVKIETVDEHGLQLKLDVESIKLTLSFTKWKDLKGIVENVEIQGLTGVIDRRNVNPDTPEVDWFENKGYEIESLRIVDSMVHVYQPDSDEPLKIALYNCEIPKVRVRWLLLDVLNAVDISGSLNGSLFTIHKRQHQLAYVTDVENDVNPWKKIMRYRLDPIELSSIGINTTMFNWLVGGKVDILADIMPPADDDDDKNTKYAVLDFKFQFHDLKAILPTTPPTLSDGQEIITLDELKPIVAYVNNKRAEGETASPIPPLCFRIVKRVDELENVSTLRESKLPDAIATELYIDLIKHVQEHEIEQRNQRIAMWSKTIASQLLVVGLGAMA